MHLVPPTDKTLWTVAKPVTNYKTEVAPYIAEMTKIILLNEGLGLSAPQVGIPARFFITREPEIHIYINPQYAFQHLQFRMEELAEGCLTWPGQEIPIYRPSNIEVRYSEANGATVRRFLHGIRARVFQHETDHLDGRCIFPKPEIIS